MQLIMVNPDTPDMALLAQAAEVIRQGGVIAYPTDTVYGLGADPHNDAAVSRIFAIKGRQASKALSLIVADADQLQGLGAKPSEAALKLMEAFWPGPLTLVLPLAKGVRMPALRGQAKVAVRIPASRLCRELATLCGPITATSANRSGEREPTTAAEVEAALGRQLDLIIDGGRSPSAIPSTIVDVSIHPPVVLRAGAIPEPHIRAALEGRQ
ncbi:MAG: L-threonylcarbamoyladenylate synthase [candidate division KSB1 bacterium]|nr:L-threonylcarbamoyladenylate synthase [candidate division KSB1 bacterium]